MRSFRVSFSERRSTFSMSTVYLFDFVFPSASPSISFLFGFLVRQERQNFRRRVQSHFGSTHWFFDASQRRMALPRTPLDPHCRRRRHFTHRRCCLFALQIRRAIATTQDSRSDLPFVPSLNWLTQEWLRRDFGGSPLPHMAGDCPLCVFTPTQIDPSSFASDVIITVAIGESTASPGRSDRCAQRTSVPHWSSFPMRLLWNTCGSRSIRSLARAVSLLSTSGRWTRISWRGGTGLDGILSIKKMSGG
jgi:hypothetical protein